MDNTDAQSLSVNSNQLSITNGNSVSLPVYNAGSGINVSGTYPNFSISNTLPDQTVSIISGNGISATGTYPNFTITNTLPHQTVNLTHGGATIISRTYPNFTISSTDNDQQTLTFNNNR